MAGNKMNIKNKSGKDGSKPGKSSNQPAEADDLDCAMLRKPIMTSVTGFAQARKIFDLATEELKDLLSNECDLLYECKVCRNIFRSIANLISHKRIYCKEKFKPSSHGHFGFYDTLKSELKKIKRIEDGYIDSLIENEEDDEDRIPVSKDLTSIVEKLTKTRGVPQDVTGGVHQMTLQKIPGSSVAMFQSSQYDDEQTNSMLLQVQELDELLSRDQATLKEDGKFATVSSRDGGNDNVIQISDEDSVDENRLKCKTCDMTFSTMKTLRFHMKYKHNESRLVYPCPDCLDIFSTSWSVYRHLFKVHRKSAAQIRRLRESIQAKAFKMNNPPAFYEKRKNVKPAAPVKLTDEERIDQENQAWMENLECVEGGPRCGGCGRAFERRAALAAHAHTCQPRRHALSTRKIEIQIRRDYNKTNTAQPKSSQDENAQSSFTKEPETDKKVQDDEDMSLDADSQNSNDKESNTSESPEKVDEEKPEKTNVSPLKSKIKLMFTIQAEKLTHNLATLKQKMATDLDVEHRTCKKCDNKFPSPQALCDHMAMHYKWVRYSCKLCNYKHYYFDMLTEHVRVVHKMKGDSDFYYSTVKAIDGNEATEISAASLATDVKPNKINSNSSRPSRCSSDSSRLSDDSSSNTVRNDGRRKRKSNQPKPIAKKKKEEKDDINDMKDGVITMDKVISAIIGEHDSNSKGFDENSSEIDEEYKSTPKKSPPDNDIQTVTSRRPVRKRTKPKNADFEYDLSNLLKMEAQGYREAQASSVTPKTTIQIKKKTPTEKETANATPKDAIKDFSGALLAMAKKALETNSAHIRPYDMNVFKSKEPRNIPFVRPQLPKILSKPEKYSPKKSLLLDSNVKTYEREKPKTYAKENGLEEKRSNDQAEKKNNGNETDNNVDAKSLEIDKDMEIIKVTNEKSTTENLAGFVPVMVPVRFRKQSIDVAKVNKSISTTDISPKPGLKTKILLIKPINKNKDNVTVPPKLKFQTIKIKDKKTLLESSEVKVVKIPSVTPVAAQAEPIANNSVATNNDSLLACNDNDKIESKEDTTANEEIVETVDEPTDEQIVQSDERSLTEADVIEAI